MTTHAYHPREGTSNEPILFDDCPRCAEAADDPIAHCDHERVKALYRKAVEAEHEGGYYRSQNEKKACIKMWRIALFLERYLAYDTATGTGVDPWTLFADEVPA